MFGGSGRGFGRGGPRKDPPTSHDIPLTLEDLYKYDLRSLPCLPLDSCLRFRGITKKFNITKNIQDARGSSRQEKKTLEVEIKPGYKDVCLFPSL